MGALSKISVTKQSKKSTKSRKNNVANPSKPTLDINTQRMTVDTQFDARVLSIIVSGQVIPRIASSVIKPINKMWTTLNLVFASSCSCSSSQLATPTSQKPQRKLCQNGLLIQSQLPNLAPADKTINNLYISLTISEISVIVSSYNPLDRITRTSGFCNSR